MPKKLGVAVVGFDHWYTAFPTAEAAKTMRDTRLVALADRSQARLKEVTAKYEPEYATTDIGRVIADESVDVICSLINTRDNVEVTKQALRAGKHVICVKPMAMNLRQVDQLIALAEKQDRVLWCFDQLGRTSVDPRVKAALKGTIGTPLVFYHVMAAGLPKSWPNNTASGWWIDPELVPWGAWADHSIYTIDMLRALLDSDVVEAYGTIANRVHTKLGVEDHGLGVLRFDNGLTAVIEDSWTADGYGPHWTKIVGTKGVVHMDRVAFSDPVVIATAKGVKPAPARGAQKRSFLDVPLKLIRDGVTDPSPARDSRRNMEIALAVYQASKTGKYQALGEKK